MISAHKFIRNKSSIICVIAVLATFLAIVFWMAHANDTNTNQNRNDLNALANQYAPQSINPNSIHSSSWQNYQNILSAPNIANINDYNAYVYVPPSGTPVQTNNAKEDIDSKQSHKPVTRRGRPDPPPLPKSHDYQYWIVDPPKIKFDPHKNTKVSDVFPLNALYVNFDKKTEEFEFMLYVIGVSKLLRSKFGFRLWAEENLSEAENVLINRIYRDTVLVKDKKRAFVKAIKVQFTCPESEPQYLREMLGKIEEMILTNPLWLHELGDPERARCFIMTRYWENNMNEYTIYGIDVSLIEPDAYSAKNITFIAILIFDTFPEFDCNKSTIECVINSENKTRRGVYVVKTPNNLDWKDGRTEVEEYGTFLYRGTMICGRRSQNCFLKIRGNEKNKSEQISLDEFAINNDAKLDVFGIEIQSFNVDKHKIIKAMQNQVITSLYTTAISNKIIWYMKPDMDILLSNCGINTKLWLGNFSSIVSEVWNVDKNNGIVYEIYVTDKDLFAKTMNEIQGGVNAMINYITDSWSTNYQTLIAPCKKAIQDVITLISEADNNGTRVQT